MFWIKLIILIWVILGIIGGIIWTPPKNLSIGKNDIGYWLIAMLYGGIYFYDSILLKIYDYQLKKIRKRKNNDKK